jgi:hypothetical protein
VLVVVLLLAVQSLQKQLQQVRPHQLVRDSLLTHPCHCVLPAAAAAAVASVA